MKTDMHTHSVVRSSNTIPARNSNNSYNDQVKSCSSCLITQVKIIIKPFLLKLLHGGDNNSDLVNLIFSVLVILLLCFIAKTFLVSSKLFNKE